MQYVVTEVDKALIQQSDIDYKIKISIVSKDGNVLGILTGVSNLGSFDVDSESDIRRTTSLDIKLDDFYKDIETTIETYLNLNFELEIGIQDKRSEEFIYYKMGTYHLTDDVSTSYDSTSNTLFLKLADGFVKLDGTRNGQIGGAPTITIPVEYEDTYNTLKSAMIEVIKTETDIKDYIVDDVGEYYGMPQNNENYEQYRLLHPRWNVIPYDLVFNAGDTVSDLIIKIRDLYPNCQVYFDVFGNFCFDMIPSNSKVPILLSDDYIQSILVSNDSEHVKYDIGEITNVYEVWGKTYEVDRFANENVSFDSNIYNITLDEYDGYYNYEMISFISSGNNGAESFIKINNFDVIPLYIEYTTEYIKTGTIVSGDMVVVQLRKDTDGNFVAYYLGQYQPHALCILTEDINDSVYTKEYFSKKYNCQERNIEFVEVKNSPFSIQKLGIVFKSMSGNDYDNILSDSVARDNARYLIYKSSVWHDTVTIKTKIMPWLDVNTKIEYKKKQENDTYVYLVNKLSHSLQDHTTEITMYRFSTLYIE